MEVRICERDSGCRGNEIWDKVGYNLACVGDMSEILACNGVFWVKLSNDISQILRRLTCVAPSGYPKDFCCFSGLISRPLQCRRPNGQLIRSGIMPNSTTDIIRASRV